MTKSNAYEFFFQKNKNGTKTDKESNTGYFLNIQLITCTYVMSSAEGIELGALRLAA